MKSNRKMFPALLSFLFTAVGFLITPTIGVAQGKIAFVSLRDGNQEIYTMNADGGSQTRLTNNPAFDRSPAMSPDGDKIAFVSTRDGDNEIYVINTDGSGSAVQVTNNSVEDSDPTWSPDGAKIAFTTYRDGNAEIYLMNADGSGAVNLTSNPQPDYQPAFNPDGNKIAFITERDIGGLRVFVMNADGSGQASLNYGIVAPSTPSFSLDGQKILFSAGFPGSFHVFLLSLNGGDPVQLTTEGNSNTAPRFSPNGMMITFASDRNGNSEIYTMTANGANQTNVTVQPAADFSPSWSRSGPPPVLSGLSVSSPVNEGGSATLTGNVAVPNAGDAFSLRVDWGDGSAVQTFNYAAATTAFSETHVYADNPTGSASGSYTITAIVDDLEGGIDSASTAVTVNNLPPIINALALESASVVVGSAATITGSYTDEGYHGNHSDEQLTVLIDWGDGFSQYIATTGSAAAFIKSRTYAALGNYTISVTVSDHDGGATTGTLNVSVTLPPPPAAPTLLRVDSISKDRMTVVWIDNSDNEDGFAVEACQNNGCTRFREIGRTAANVTTYTDFSLLPNTQYFYRVRAFNTGGFSAYSNKASGKTLRK